MMQFRTVVTNTVSSTIFTVISPSSTGLGTGSPGYQLQLTTNFAAKPSTNIWTMASDVWLKKNIRLFTEELEVLEQPHTVRHQYDGLAGMAGDEESIGVITRRSWRLPLPQ